MADEAPVINADEFYRMVEGSARSDGTQKTYRRYDPMLITLAKLILIISALKGSLEFIKQYVEEDYDINDRSASNGAKAPQYLRYYLMYLCEKQGRQMSVNGKSYRCLGNKVRFLSIRYITFHASANSLRPL
jgi:hypothetical protein